MEDKKVQEEITELKSFLYHHGEELVGFGKYADMKYKDVPEGYFTFVYWNYRANGTNARAREYGRILVQRRKLKI